jgi:cytochrome P450
MNELPDIDQVDFAFDEMPGEEMHRILHAYRDRGPLQSTHFMGLPAFIITGHRVLLDAFMDTEKFPPHRMYKTSFEGAIGETFISMEDSRKHLAYRRLATPAFRSRAVARYQRDELAGLAHELIDRLEGIRSFDLVETFTTRFPFLVISRLMGLPRDRESEFQDWAFALLNFRDDPATAMIAKEKLTEFLAPAVEERRREPRGDVISELIQARVGDRALSDEEIYSHIRLIFPTGGETTHGALGNFFSLLLGSKSLWQRLRAEPARLEDAVEESLRLETPIAVLPRLSAETDIQFHGIEIPANSWVLFAMAAANRDPEIFPEPDRFDLDRKSEESLTFGRGVKACPGAHLARKNMTVAAQVLLERLPDLELLDHEAALPRKTVLRCPAALRVRA